MLILGNLLHFSDQARSNHRPGGQRSPDRYHDRRFDNSDNEQQHERRRSHVEKSLNPNHLIFFSSFLLFYQGDGDYHGGHFKGRLEFEFSKNGGFCEECQTQFPGGSYRQHCNGDMHRRNNRL